MRTAGCRLAHDGQRRDVGSETVTETVTAQAALVSGGVGDRSATRSVERGSPQRSVDQRSPKTAGPGGAARFLLRPPPPAPPKPSTSAWDPPPTRQTTPLQRLGFPGA